ncbi:MAG TPA: cobalamin-dependent protein [Rectinemataceae bacterium]|nr:cobalamin-dependent protein [Rectinemataceae bacterium]
MEDTERPALDESAVAAEAFGILLALKPDLASRYGPAALARCREDMRHHVRFLYRAHLLKSDALLDDYLGWLKVLFVARKIPDEELLASFRCIAHALKSRVPDADAAALRDLVERAIFAYPRISADALSWSKECVDPGSPATAYLKALLDGRRGLAEEYVAELAEKGLSIRDLYLEIFQPSQRELGRLWMKGLINPAQEHFASACTQYIISTYYPAMFEASRHSRNGRRLLAAAAPGERHEIGLRMVTDLLEMEGWETRYLGADVPADALIDMARNLEADIVALSATMLPGASELGPLIDALRARLPRLKIIVGGRAFIVDGELAARLGADGSADDCAGALGLVAGLAAG